MVKNSLQCRRYRGHGFNSLVGKISGVGNGNSLQYSCLENPMDRGAWLQSMGVTKSEIGLSMHATGLKGWHRKQVPFFFPSLGEKENA